MRFERHTRTILLALLAAAACAGSCGAPAFTASAATDAVNARLTGGSSPAIATGARSSSQPSHVNNKVANSGIATWFGPGFYGQKTACGQTLTPSVVGVANRTLPCGTLVKVDYHGQTLVVPVLDRGPYADNGASWDLTAGAASALDISGTVRIATHVVGSVRNTPALGSPQATPAQAASGGVQAG
jgi:rare lipoprotein A (peptidoglycan hydrolase)